MLFYIPQNFCIFKDTLLHNLSEPYIKQH